MKSKQTEWRCVNCHQIYYQKAQQVFGGITADPNAPECPHCFLVYRDFPKDWKERVIKIRREKDAFQKKHKNHRIDDSAYHPDKEYCYDCHQIVVRPVLPFIQTRGNEMTSSYYGSTTVPFYSSSYYTATAYPPLSTVSPYMSPYATGSDWRR